MSDHTTLRDELKQIDEQIKSLEERRRQIYKASLEAPEEEKVAIDCISEMISDSEVRSSGFPMTIAGIAWVDTPPRREVKPELVAVRPCDGEKTYAGIHVGDLPLGIHVILNRNTGVLTAMPAYHNPAIVVPELGKLVMGCGSWWKRIKTQEDLKQISDEDILNVWYVRAILDKVEKKEN
jgi:hypothetical protein